MEEKLKYFDYFILRLIKKKSGSDMTNNIYNPKSDSPALYCFNKLKLLKLLFLVASIKDSSNNDLLEIFNRFYAMPYGPVESDIYENINNIPNFYVLNNRIEVKPDYNFTYNINDSIFSRINTAIELLDQRNSHLIDMSAFDLVELTHKADSWKIVYSNALRLNKNSQLMPIDIIRKTIVYYQ